MILDPFPPPGPLVREALAVLALVAAGDPEVLETLGDPAELPRPWDPSTCPPGLRRELWGWCEQVASWINHEYAWRPPTLIPACWPAHPHLARELPSLACQRLTAQEAPGVERLEEWHRYTLPSFHDRMTTRLGESSCRGGRHQDWPAASRHAAHHDPDATTHRRHLFTTDTHPPARLSTTRPAW